VADEVERLLPEGTAGAAASGPERFPARYAERFAPSETALHARLLAEIGPHDPVRFLARPQENGEVECTALSFDHPALFSLICGALSSLGLNVLSGDAFTSLPPGSAAGGSPPGLRRRGARRETGRTRPAAAARRHVVDLLRGTVRSELDLPRWREDAAKLLSSIVRALEEGAGRGSCGRGSASTRWWRRPSPPSTSR
jgi:hypothetical protein